MSSPAQTRRDERRKAIRGRLLRAVDELAEAGESYADISIERLATTAGLSRATFYIYFDGKADLLAAWFDETLVELAGACATWLALDANSTRADLRTALAEIVDTYRAHASLLAAVADEATQDNSLRQRRTAAIDRSIEALQAQIARAQRAGWGDPALLPADTAGWLIWLMERGLHQIVPSADDEQVSGLIDALATMLWRTLYGHSAGV